MTKFYLLVTTLIVVALLLCLSCLKSSELDKPMITELLIEKTEGSGNWVRLDLGTELPVMNFQANDFKDLVDRRASYSQALRLPLTAENCAAFGFANIFEAQSNYPYQIHACEWLVDGIRVVGSGYKLCLLKVTDSFECQIVSRVHGLFDTLDNTPMADLEIGQFIWDHSAIKSVVEADDPENMVYFMPSVTLKYSDTQPWAQLFVGGDSSGPYGAPQMGLYCGTWLPYLRFLPLVKQIFREQGYAVEESVATTPGYAEAFIALSNLKNTAANLAPLAGVATGYGTQIAGPVEIRAYILSNIATNTFKYNQVHRYEDDIYPIKDPEVEGENNYGWVYVATGKCAPIFTLQAITTYTGARYRYRVRKYGAPVVGKRVGNIETDVVYDSGNELPADTKTVTTEPIELRAGEKVFIEIIVLSAPSTIADIKGQVSVSFDAESSPNIIPGSVVYPAESTPFKSQLEVVRAFLQLYNLLISVDEDSKVVKLVSYLDILGRVKANDYYDWSNKVCINGQAATSFTPIGYGQFSTISFKANSELDYLDQYNILVNNTNLPNTIALLEVPFNSLQNREVTVFGAANPIQTAITIAYEKTGDIGYRLVRQPSGAIVENIVTLYDSVDPGAMIVGRELDASEAIYDYHRRIQMVPSEFDPIPGVSYDTIIDGKLHWAYYFSAAYYTETYFSTLQNYLLNPYREVEEELYLDPVDITNLDLLRPVYLDKYKDFFMIQKIHNYTPSKTTKVTLISLNIAR